MNFEDSVANWTDLGAEYKRTPLEQTMEMMKRSDGQQVGDIWKGAERIFEVVTSSGTAEGQESLLRLRLGKAPTQALREKAHHFKAVAERV